ncbi:winged helix domain-containing protein [Sphingomonas oligophenolica]|uniref:winged helix domain-containing protein n=1 Tax=Sphingomonas oligophenolica TaxID=301154 RepID=UPI00138667C4|nr:hypothetical protein [Sphingomonas oligophenolica]
MPPKAGATAKGSDIARKGITATRRAYPASTGARKPHFLYASGPGGVIVVRGQVARTLRELVKAGSLGLTSLECGTWAYRLAAYVHELRRDHDLIVETVREDHEGGWHGRYVLRSPVRLEANQ